MIELTDNELLQDYARNGSESAFAQLVGRKIDLVYSSALRIVVDPHLAEDVTQATFATLAKEARHLTGRIFLSVWLHRTASNLASNLVRGEMRRRVREQEAYAMQSVQPEPEPGEWNQVASLLDASLNKLTESDRVVILLRYFEKKTANEIGLALRLTEEAAQKRVTRALDRLRGLLAGSGVRLSTTALATLIASQAVIAAPLGLSTSVSAAALAGSAVAGGITLTTLKLIAMSKLKVTAVSALVVAGVATPLVLQHQNLSRLRDENQSLQQQVQQADGFRSENDDLSRQLTDARQSQRLSKAQLSELVRLRGEVGPLRRDSQELARLRAGQQANQTTPPAAPPGTAAQFIPAAAWANVGADQPEAAIQTFLWAAKHGETNLIADLLRWQRDAEIPESGELDQTFAQGLVAGTTRFAGSLQGFRIESESQDGDEVRVGIELTDEEGKAQPHTLRLVREENQWFPVMHVWLQEPGSVRAALDVPPKFETAR